MADKSFGIKQINLIGSGTPTLQSASGLNITSGITTFSGSVIVGTGATIEPNGQVIFAGIITANSGVRVNADSGNPDAASATNYFSVGASEDLKIYHNSGTNYIAAPNGDIQIKADTFQLVSDDTNARAIFLDNSNSRLELGFDGNHAIHVKATGTEFIKDVTVSTGATIQTNGAAAFAGTVTATGFSGSGNDIVTSRWTLGANGSSDYTFTGPGGLSGTADPKIYLARGHTYEFVNNSGGSHPFQIQTSGGAAYNTGVTNNNASSGTIKFEVPFSAPNSLQYKCTNHSSMGNTIIIYPDLSP